MRLCLAALATLIVLPAFAQQPLRQEPPAGALAPGQRVLVDDGSCPKGQIKLVVGGNNMQQGLFGMQQAGTGAQRQRSCIARKRAG